jgi:hypothetical protein
MEKFGQIFPHRSINRIHISLFLVLALSLFLNTYANTWGLPLRWHPDEYFVANADTIIDTRDIDELIKSPLYTKVMVVLEIPVRQWTKIFITDAANSSNLLQTNIYRGARTLSGILGTATVLLIFMIGSAGWKPQVGLLAALFLTLSMGFVNLAHFATYDIFTIFLITLTLYFCVLIVRSGQTRAYLLAGACAALAASGKPIGFLVFLPVLSAHAIKVISQPENLWRAVFRWKTHQKILLCLLVSFLVFVLVNPIIIWNFSYYYINTIKITVDYAFRGTDMFTHQALDFSQGTSNWIMGFFNLLEMMNLPLLLLGIIGGFFAGYRAVRSRDQVAILCLVWIIPYAVLAGSSPVPLLPLRQVVPMIPLMVLVAALAVVTEVDRSCEWLKRIFFVGVGLILVYSMWYTTKGIVMLAHDSRYASSQWLARNLGSNGSILISGWPGYYWYFPNFSENIKARLIPSKNQDDWMVVAKMKPEYIMISSGYYGRFFYDPKTYPDTYQFYTSLLGGELNYNVVAEFPAGSRPFPKKNILSAADVYFPDEGGIWQPHPEFVNPTILIFEKSGN